MTPNTITVYYGGSTVRVVRGEHLPHADADKGRVLVYPSPEVAHKLITKDVPVSHRTNVLAALERIYPVTTMNRINAECERRDLSGKIRNSLSMRKCAHPAGCELLALDGDIYCVDCATDRNLAELDRDAS